MAGNDDDRMCEWSGDKTLHYGERIVPWQGCLAAAEQWLGAKSVAAALQRAARNVSPPIDSWFMAASQSRLGLRTSNELVTSSLNSVVTEQMSSGPEGERPLRR